MKRVLLSLLVSIAAMGQQPTQQQSKSVLASQNGRFVFGQISDSRADQYLLDTQTGRLWVIRTHELILKDGTKDPYPALDPVPFFIDQSNLFRYLPPNK